MKVSGYLVLLTLVTIIIICLGQMVVRAKHKHKTGGALGQKISKRALDVGVQVQGAASRELLAREVESLRQLSRVISDILLELNRNAFSAKLLPTSFKVKMIESGLRKHSREVEIFNTLSKKQQHNFIVNILIKDKVAMQAYEDNLETIKRLNEFNVDPDAVLMHAKQLSS